MPSREEREINAAKLQKHIENSSEFRQKMREAKEGGKAFGEDRRREYEDNAEVQRNRSMSKDQRAAEAVDRMTESIKTFNDTKTGKETSRDEARQKARELARRSGIADA